MRQADGDQVLTESSEMESGNISPESAYSLFGDIP